MEYNIKEKSDSLKLGYLIGISIVVFLILFSHFIMIFSNKKSEHDSHIINIAGRQRMLSQKITKAAYGIYLSQTMSERDKFRRELKSAVELWKESHLGLRVGNLELGLPGNNSSETEAIYTQINDAFEIIVDNSYRILEIDEDNPNLNEKLKPYITKITENEGLFLPGMNKIVFMYEEESKSKFKRAQVLNFILLLTILLVLVMECILIFMPLMKEIRQKIENLIVNEKNMKKLFDVSPKMMCLVDPFSFKILRMNELALYMVGLNKESQPDYLITDFIEEKFLRQMSIDYVHRNSKELKEIEITLKNVKGEKTAMLMSLSTMYYHKRKVFLIGLTNISEQKNQEQILRHYATVDYLTGLLNRRSGMILLEEAFRLLKNKDFDMTICFIDIENLAEINSMFGHSQGDTIRKQIAEIILRNIHSEDIAFRYGGDEVVICFKYINPRFAKLTLDKIENEVKLLSRNYGELYKLEISYGFSEYKDSYPETIEDFIRAADENMYSIKKEKKIQLPLHV